MNQEPFQLSHVILLAQRGFDYIRSKLKKKDLAPTAVVPPHTGNTLNPFSIPHDSELMHKILTEILEATNYCTLELTVAARTDVQSLARWSQPTEKAWLQFFAEHLGGTHPALPTRVQVDEETEAAVILVVRVPVFETDTFVGSLREKFPSLEFSSIGQTTGLIIGRT